jgi:acetone carboxylase gamma subunit
MKMRITEYLEVDLEKEAWVCVVCGHGLGSARTSYKHGCLVADRDPAEVMPPIYVGATYHLGITSGYGRFVEFYCPSCATLIETELLPEGYPPNDDIELDIEALKAKATAHGRGGAA